MSSHARRTRVDLEQHPGRGEPAPPKESRPCVAVVDDDRFFRRSLQRLVETMGFDVVAFGSAEEFLAYPHKQRLRCLLLDYHLPGMCGSELLSRLGDAHDPLPVILISSDAEVGWTVRAPASVISILRKPVDADVLGSALATTLPVPLER